MAYDKTSYYKFMDQYAQQPYGSCEVFRVQAGDIQYADSDGNALEPGWYWQACYPGCTPDSDPVGPFPTKEATLDDAEVA